jgi:single-strand DNA-binding protein
MLNHIVLMGRLVRDPELRQTQSGISVVSFRIAVDRDYQSRDGGDKQADFIDIVAWRSTAEFVSKYFTKGRMAVVSGRLQVREWTDKENNKRYSTEVVADNVYFGDSKPGGQGGGQAPGGRTGGSSYGGGYDAPPIQTDFREDDEDDPNLPF